ncbi:Uncharacterised protein [Candidatus Tiddalikarchaeum anstoanum]|nr:Uncharacterised protein [Candidatus Tiddalikarchaeum anstoanum]
METIKDMYTPNHRGVKLNPSLRQEEHLVSDRSNKDYVTDSLRGSKKIYRH